MMNFGNMFNGMFGPVGKGMCKIGIDGNVAIKVGDSFKTFDHKTFSLVNCDNFAFDMEGAFWVVPTTEVAVGDIIVVNKQPKNVIEVKESSIKVFNYLTSALEEIVPERHVFMGKTYCYGKIFTPFVNMSKDNDVMQNLMSMIMMSQMFGGRNGMGGDFNPMLFMMMGDKNPFAQMFNGAFKLGTSDKGDE